jgi:hypothetical protein
MDNRSMQLVREQIKKITLEHDKEDRALRAIEVIFMLVCSRDYGCLEKMDQMGKLSSISPNSTVRTPHNVEKNLDFNYNCSPGESWGCGILPRVTMSQEKAESCKRQAASHKQQATSSKRQATSCSSRVGSKAFGGEKGATNCRASLCHKDSRCKRQASSPKQQASSCKPRAASSLIFFPS